MDDSDPFPKRDRRNQRSRLEIRLVLAVVAAVMVLGALYVFIFGSPTAERRAVDSSDSSTASVFGDRDAAPAQ